MVYTVQLYMYMYVYIHLYTGSLKYRMEYGLSKGSMEVSMGIKEGNGTESGIQTLL